MSRKAINYLVSIMDEKKAELRGTPEYPEFVEQVVEIMGLITSGQEAEDKKAGNLVFFRCAIENTAEELSNLSTLTSFACEQLKLMWKQEQVPTEKDPAMNHYQLHSLMNLIDGQLMEQEDYFRGMLERS